MTDDIAIEVPTEADWPAIFAADALAFHQTGTDEALRELAKGSFEFPRSLVARRDGRIVGVSSAYTRDLVVPGAVVPTSHITWVSVAATARRRGVLTRFIHRLLDDARALGEPIAALHATEGRIYQRFGFGLASVQLELTAATRELSLPPAGDDAGTLHEAPPAELRDALVKVFDATLAEHPGWSSRAERHWNVRLADPPSWRDGAGPVRAVVHSGAAGPDGYVLFRVKESWADGGPEGEVKVRELVATTPQALAELWRFLLNIDLTRKVTWWMGAADDPVFYLINEPRHLTPKWGDGIWLRVLDVPAALAARRYAAPVSVVLDLTDALIPSNAGRWRLVAGPNGTASCVATSDEPDLALDVKELGAAYLGGTSLATLAAAGRVRELTPGALARTATAFSWHRQPSTVEMF